MTGDAKAGGTPLIRFLARVGSREPLEACNTGLNNPPSRRSTIDHPHNPRCYTRIQTLRHHKPGTHA
ncbi:MAG: hypothetical protein WC295_00860 [Methanoregula sp.]